MAKNCDKVDFILNIEKVEARILKINKKRLSDFNLIIALYL